MMIMLIEATGAPSVQKRGWGTYKLVVSLFWGETMGNPSNENSQALSITGLNRQHINNHQAKVSMDILVGGFKHVYFHKIWDNPNPIDEL